MSVLEAGLKDRIRMFLESGPEATLLEPPGLEVSFKAIPAYFEFERAGRIDSARSTRVWAMSDLQTERAAVQFELLGCPW